MILLDTNVVSELMRPKPSPEVVAWVAGQAGPELFTTAITQAEILLGIELLPRGKRREGLLGAAEAIFAKDFDGRILAFESEAARLFASIVAHRRSVGLPISDADAQIAAITRLRGAHLATRNVMDFAHCGIGLVDPWNVI